MILKVNDAGITGCSYRESDSKVYVEVNHDIFEYRHVPKEVYAQLQVDPDPAAFIMNQIDTKFEKAQLLPDDY